MTAELIKNDNRKIGQICLNVGVYGLLITTLTFVGQSLIASSASWRARL